jgi:hypothetical protein
MGLITKGLRELERSYKKVAHQLHIAEARAVKRAGVSVRAAQVRDIAAQINLRAGTIRDEVRIAKDATSKNLSVTFRVKERGVPLKEFIGTNQTRKGVSVKVIKASTRQTLGAAFGARKFGGHFFGRVAKGSKKYGNPHVGRLPIAKLYGPSILSQYIKDAIAQKGAETWHTRIEIELQRETTFALRKAGVID